MTKIKPNGPNLTVGHWQHVPYVTDSVEFTSPAIITPTNHVTNSEESSGHHVHAINQCQLLADRSATSHIQISAVPKQTCSNDTEWQKQNRTQVQIQSRVDSSHHIGPLEDRKQEM